MFFFIYFDMYYIKLYGYKIIKRLSSEALSQIKTLTTSEALELVNMINVI